MGVYLSKLYDLLRDLGSSQPRRILMLGLDAAGKTTILYKLKLDENLNTIPTIGFNVEEVKIGKGLTFTIWDVGGQERIRPLWRCYYSSCHALIYVVDSNDPERIEEAKNELFSILECESTKETPIIVIANKQDLPNAMPPSRIVEGLELRKIERNHKWHIQACCAVSGDGLYEAMEMVGKMSTDFIKNNKMNW